MRFFSDNAAAACPEVLEALVRANHLDTAYDRDRWSERLDGAFSDLFGKPVRALWVTTGTAANCLGLATLCPPHGAILCHEVAHIEVDEAGAPGFFTHGGKLTLLPGHGAKLSPETVEDACAKVRDDVHQASAIVLTRWLRSGTSRRSGGWAFTWTGRVSPMPSPSPEPSPRTSPGALAST
jgi:threonine aldolase